MRVSWQLSFTFKFKFVCLLSMNEGSLSVARLSIYL